MAKRRIEGSFVALITPMNNNGSVDFEGFRTLLDFQEKNGEQDKKSALVSTDFIYCFQKLIQIDL